VVTDEALDFLEDNKDQPFLLCLWYYDVHAPYQGKEDLKNYYAGKIGPDHLQRSPTMGAMVGNMDSNFGRIMEKIKELDLEKETIIIFTSDNGGNMYDGPDGTTPTNNYPLRAGKGINYEGGTRVPLIVKVPGLTKAGSESEVVVSTVDHYESLLELLGIIQEEVITDGRSYVPALKRKAYERDAIYSTFCHYTPATGGRPNISMRQGPWRFYKFYFDGPEREHRHELYNLDEDIGETNNLAEQMPEKVQEMLTQLDAHVEEANILLPRLNQDYEGNVADAWQGSEDTRISVTDRILSIESTGKKPSVETVFTPNISDGTFKFVFEMKSESSGMGFLSWKSGADKEYEAQKSTSFAVNHNGDWNKYSIEIPLEGVLKTLKIQPSSEIGTMEIRNLELQTLDGYYIRDWPLY
jgi:hypothetical protein